MTKCHDVFEPAEDDEKNKAMWEQGQPDYMGSAATDNIMQKLDSVVGKPNP